MKKILLLGSTGLIGSQVYRTLAEKYKITRLGRRNNCEVKADLTKPESLKDLRLEDHCAVVHCAGVTDEDFRDRTAEAFVQSTLGIEALIKTAIENRIEKFIYISTSHVYGRQVGAINEDSPANPLSNYAIAHYAAEQTLKKNTERFKNIFVLRPNAVFGEPISIDKFDRWNLIPYSFPLEAVYSQKIVLRSSGEQNRNFVATEDIANYIGLFLTKPTKERFLLVNPLGGSTLSVYDFALKCAEIFNRISGTNCVVERPEQSAENHEESFSYISNLNFVGKKVDLDKSMSEFMDRIFEELKNGKKYQA